MQAFTITIGPGLARSVRGLLLRGAVRILLGVAGFGIGIAGAVLAYGHIHSVWLGLFVFLVARHVVSRALSGLIAKPRRPARALYFALMPAASIAVVWATYGAWERMWAAVILGLVSGSVAEAVIGGRLVPSIRAEEEGIVRLDVRAGRAGRGRRAGTGAGDVEGEYRRLGDD